MLFANVQYLKGKYDSLVTANFSPTGAPVTTGCRTLGSRAANPGINAARFINSNYRPEEVQDAFVMADAFVTLRSQAGWSITGFVNNLTDEEVLARAGTWPILDFPVATLRPPRTYGVRVGFDF